MDWRHLLMMIASAGQIIGIVIYVTKMIKEQTKPHLASWILWTIWPMIAFAAAISQGVAWAAIPTFVSGFVSLCVVIAQLTLRQADWKIRPVDCLFGALSITAVCLWLVTDKPNIALVLSIVGDFASTVPVLIKSWRFPKSESILAYAICGLNAMTSFLFVVHWNFEEIAYPIYLVLFNLFIIFLFLIRPKTRRLTTSKG